MTAVLLINIDLCTYVLPHKIKFSLQIIISSLIPIKSNHLSCDCGSDEVNHGIYLYCQQMQQETSQLDKEDSDNDEGFIVNTVQIKEKEAFKLNTQLQARPTDYQPRYISANNLLKRQIPQLVTSYPHFSREETIINEFQPKKKLKETVMHPEQRYFNNKNYRLVYQRYSRRIETDDSYSQNEVSLASVVSYSSDNYSIVKNWDFAASSDQLVFESRFESGNLALVYRSLTQPNSYILFMHNDTNSKGYNKWFYFAVKNAKKNATYNFSIVNFRKYFGFFKQGMRPIKFSQKEHKSTGNGWSRCGKNIQFYRSQLSNKSDPDTNIFYTLSFEVSFQQENDINYFSLLPPYSYSKLINFIQEAKHSSKQRENFKFQIVTIAHSLGNTQVPYLTFTAAEPTKKNIVILARQHPGQVWSSFLTESIIRQLMRDSNLERDWLLKNYNFRIFPMINVDGVIYGNFRCDLSGMDLNRNWKNPNKLLHPHLYAIKEEIARLSREEEVVCCLDMHSHSKDYNIFAYCCKTDNEGRVLPLLLSRMTPLFHFPSCTFGISKYKESTARATIYELSKTNDVLTIESSFFGFNNPLKTIHPAIFHNVANAILKALKFYYSKSKEYLQAEQALPKAMAEVAELRARSNDKLFDEQSGSDSQPECDQIAITQKIGKILPKCTTVQVALGLVKEENEKQELKLKDQPAINKKKHSRPKKQESRMVQRQPIQLETIQTKVQRPPVLFPGRSLNNDHQLMLMKVLKKTEKAKRQEKKEPSYIGNDQYQQVLHLGTQRRNQSLQLPVARNSMQKNFLTAGFRDTIRQKSGTRYQLHYKYQRRQQQEFPLLCVLSDKKKQAHLQKLKRIHPTPSQRQRPIIRYQPTLIINKKLDTMERLRQRQKNSNELVTSLWKESTHFQYDYPQRSIFYGGL